MGINQRETNSRKPNILWICSDQQRFDTIRALGNRNINTPVLDRLVENGVEYFPDSEVLVSRLISNEGYFCGLIGKLHLSASQAAVERRPQQDGYRTFAWAHHPYPDVKEAEYVTWLRREKGVDPEALYESLTGSMRPGVPTEYHQTTWCAERAMSFIRDHREVPWYLNINMFSPHPTFRPPKEFLDRYDPAEMPYPLFRESNIEHQKKFRHLDQQTTDAVNPYVSNRGEDEENSSLPLDQRASVPPSSYDARFMRACYYTEIELIDRQIGRIVECLEETDQLQDTIILFMSDHGELLGDHGLLHKGCRFFEALVHVPLIISWPEGYGKNLRSAALVELVDLAPTLLEALGKDVPYTMQGKSLHSILAGRRDPDRHKDRVFSEYNDCLPTAALYADGRETDQTHSTMHFDGRFKVSIYHGHNLGEIYDLESDPGEFHDLWDEPDFQRKKMRLLVDHMEAMASTISPGIRRIKDY